MTKEEAKEKLRALRESIAHARINDSRDGADGKPGPIEERMMGLRKRLGEAVEAGKLTEDEAKEKWAEIAKQAKEKGKKMKGHVNERIKAALKAGKITEEEANGKWEAVRKMADE